MISGTGCTLILFRRVKCPALATRDVMFAFRVELLRSFCILTWDVLELVSVLFDNALEASVSLDCKHGDLLCHRLELGVVNVHSRRGFAFGILFITNKTAC